jgi:Type VI secretion system (T6SS), amidase effector protein 4
MPTTTQATTNTTARSTAPAQVDVRSSVNFDAMWTAHPMNWIPAESTPWRKKKETNNPLAVLTESEPVYENQCAIKLSIALEAGGISLNTFPKARVETRPVERLNGKKMRGALAAEELSTWLNKALDKPSPLAADKALAAVQNKKGIVFFKDFWTRTNETTPQGDHIDLWNGKHLPGHPPGAAGHQATLDYFSRSKLVLFWELK